MAIFDISPMDLLEVVLLLLFWLIILTTLHYGPSFILWPLEVMLKSLHVKRTMRFQIDPKIETIDPTSDSFPSIVRKHFEQTQIDLEGLGFHPVAWMLLPAAVPDVSTILILLSKPSHCEYSTACFIFSRQDVIRMETMSYIEFNVDFASGTSVVVSNSKSIGSQSTSDRLVRYQFPENRNLDSLYSVFEKIADRTGNMEQRVAPLLTDYHGDPVEMQRRGMLKQLEREVERGWMYVNHSVGQYRLKYVGAFIRTWQEVFPFRQIRQAANRRRNRQLLDELGISEVG